jgi:anti-sigma factor RsiW
VDCPYVFSRLSAGLDGELPADEEAALSGHVASCVGCGRQLRLLQATRAAFRSIGPAAASAGFDAGVLARLRRRPWVRSWGIAGAAAAALAQLLLRTPGRAPSNDAFPTATMAASAPPGLDVGLDLDHTGIDCGRTGATVCRRAVPCDDGQCVAPTVLSRPQLTLARD